jgi:putative transposase
LAEAIARYGAPEIFNINRGAQFTADAFTAVLKDNDVTRSMDGKSGWDNNVFVERMSCSVTHKDGYSRAGESA